MIFPAANKARYMKERHNVFLEDMDFVIEPRYKTDIEDLDKGDDDDHKETQHREMAHHEPVTKQP